MLLIWPWHGHHLMHACCMKCLNASLHQLHYGNPALEDAGTLGVCGCSGASPGASRRLGWAA